MQVSEAMSRDVKITRPDQTLREAATLMAQADVGALPVGDGDRLVGMITDRDIAVRAVGRGLGPETEIREVMSEGIKYCFEDDDLDDVARNLGDEQIRRLPVVNRDKRLVGILALADLAERGQDTSTAEAVKSISRR